MIFDLPVMDERVKPHQVTTLHMICALAFIVTGAIIAVYNYTIPAWGVILLCAGISLTIVVMARNKWLITGNVNKLFRVAELAVAATIAVYSALQHWKFPAGIFAMLCAAIVFALYWERQSDTMPTVHIDKDGVKLPATARRRFRPWTEIEEVLLRFGTLTINFTDNSFVQWDLATDAETASLEAYCRILIEDNRSKRRNDDW